MQQKLKFLTSQIEWDDFVSILAARFHDKQFLELIRPVEFAQNKTVITGSPELRGRFKLYKLALQEALREIDFSDEVIWKN